MNALKLPILLQKKLPTCIGQKHLTTHTKSQNQENGSIMSDIFTTLNPKTGLPTKEHEFANFWKWKYVRYDSNDINNSIKTASALRTKHWLNGSTPDDDVYKFHNLNNEKEVFRELSEKELRKNRELIDALEIASISIKDLKQENKRKAKQLKTIKQNLAPYLKHEEDCSVSLMKILGRVKNRATCSCGLKEILQKNK